MFTRGSEKTYSREKLSEARAKAIDALPDGSLSCGRSALKNAIVHDVDDEDASLRDLAA